MHPTTVHPRATALLPSRRLLLVLVLALLVACDQRAPAPAPASGPTAAPASVATAEAAKPLHFSSDSPAIGTEVGSRSLGVGTTTTGKAGWLLFGPYAALPAGNYQAAVQGVVLPGHVGSIYVDVVVDKGSRVVASRDLDPIALAAARSPDGMVVLPFTLAGAVTDLELRVRVTEQSQLAVSAIDLLPVR
jgi:hypothetical protein